MKEAAEQTEVTVAPTSARAGSATTAPTTNAQHLLAMQRTAGNRAVARMAGGSPRAVLARDTTTVSKFVKEETTTAENVTWTASFDVEFNEDTKICWLTINVKLVPDAGVSKEDVTNTQIGVLSRFSLLWDSKFTLHEHRSVWADRDWLLRTQVKFVDTGQHITIRLHPGKGADNRQNWYAGTPEQTHAHELSHQMGLLDEYADVTVPDRKVYTDHSIMGDYYNEGITQVEAKLRHGQRLASMIGTATDKNLTARKT
jgi:hypothetical protein